MISGRFSLINAISWYGPASNSAADKAAAEQAMEFYVSTQSRALNIIDVIFFFIQIQKKMALTGNTTGF